VVAKFFPPGRRLAPGRIRPPTETEFRNFTYLHRLGLNREPFRIARPLCYNPWLHNVWVVEHFDGHEDRIFRLQPRPPAHGRRRA